MARAGWHRGARLELSERQEEVLRLIAAGRTNYEIAQELGVSLEGAKYHVREIMTKLGVDSREEAADWWRQQRRPMVRLRRALGWWPVWVGAGGIAALGAAGLVVFLALLNSGGEGEPVGAAPTVALTAENAQILVAIANEPQSQTTGLRVFAADGSFDHTFPGYWAGPAWSPDGRFLAAFNIDNSPGYQLHIFERDGDPAGWTDRPADLPLGTYPGTMHWAGDSEKLAIFSDPTVIYDNKANLLVNSGDLVPLLGNGGFMADGSWSKDNRLFAASAGDHIVVVFPDGRVDALSTPDFVKTRIWHIREWTSNDTLAVLMQPADPSPRSDGFEESAVNISASGADWTLAGPIIADYEPEYSATITAMGSSFPNTIQNAGRTADGRGFVNTVMPNKLGSGSGWPDAFAIVRFDGADTRVELGAPSGMTRVKRTYDVVVVPKD